MLRSSLALVALAGCPHRPASGGVPLTAPELFRPGRYDYVEFESHAGLPPIENVITETWVAAPDRVAPDGVVGDVWLVENYGLPPLPPGAEPTPANPELLGATSYVMGPGGLAHYRFERGGNSREYAPKLELPPVLDTKATWTGTHGTGADQNTRTCHVERTPFCEQGAAVACDSHWANRAVWIRHHYCGGVGWVGYEAVRVSNGVATVSWSGNVTRDGVDLPTVDISLRPTPEVVVHKVPAEN